MDPVPTRALGSGYLLEQEIGGGATGRVWRGVRRRDGAQVAIKLLRSEFARDTENVVRFLRQRTVLPNVEHPNLVRVHDLVAEGDMLAVVMDLVQGRDLRQIIRESPLTREQSIIVLAQVASALDAVHAAGVVHRDVKPENVLVVWRGEAHPHAMLTDFGLAKVLDSPAFTSASVLHGTPAYIAPEVVTGRGAGPEADVYGLSVMAYELLVGVRPVQADNPAALLLAHLEAEIVRPQGMPDELWKLIRSGLAKDPAMRPTAARFAARIMGAPSSPAEHEMSNVVSMPTRTPTRSPDRTPDRTPVRTPVRTQTPDSSTMDAIRPAPFAPEPVAKRRKRWPLWVAGSLCLVLGVGGGLWLGNPDKSPGDTQPSSSAGPPLHTYYLAITRATSPKAGQIVLVFQDAKDLPGFDNYLVFRDGVPIQQLNAVDNTTFTYETGDTKTEHCFAVAALLETDNPPLGPKTEPTCLSANGKPASSRE
ncbi:MAG TPA: serine/threonine-protein kinase [Candidatus Limnocylindrales bacterium]